MQTLVNVLAVLSLLGTAVLIAVVISLLRTIRVLRESALALRDATWAPTVERPRPAVARLASDDGRPTYVLLVAASSYDCLARVRHLTSLDPARVDGNLVLLSAEAACAGWVEASAVRSVVDGPLVGRLDAPDVPVLLRFSSTGVEQWRRPVRTDEELRRHLDLRPATEANMHP